MLTANTDDAEMAAHRTGSRAVLKTIATTGTKTPIKAFNIISIAS